MPALELLAGDARTFKDKVWASRVHLHHTDPARLVGLLGLDDVDRLLTGSALRTPALRLAQGGAVLPASRYTRAATLAGQPLTGLVDARKVLDLFDDGASVVLQGLHRYWPPLTELCAELERELGHPCQANAYLTPPHSQGFAVHQDNHDVFVFQTHGRKTWEVHEGGPPRTVVLEPGVSMYLPTGTPHAAHAEEVASLHVTLGINQLTWREVLRRTVDRLLEQDDGTADRLPAGYLGNPAVLSSGLEERLERLRAGLAEIDPEEMAAAEVRRFLTTRNPRLGNGLRDRLTARELTDATPLRRRPGQPVAVGHDSRRGGERLLVLLGDRELSMPAWLAPAIDDLSGRDTFCPGDLAGMLDPESRLVLCRRLLREGLLQAAD